MTIYLVRHGKDEAGYRGGWSTRGLIGEGKIQAQKLADYLYENRDDFKFTRIICSDLVRTKETAEYIAKRFEMDIEFSEEWRETNNGVIAGLPNDQVEREFPGLYFNALNMDERYPEGESPREFLNRIEKSFYKLKDEVLRNDEDVLVVTHSGVINIIYHLIEGYEWSNDAKKNRQYKSQNTSIHRIDFNGENMDIILRNHVRHLQ